MAYSLLELIDAMNNCDERVKGLQAQINGIYEKKAKYRQELSDRIKAGETMGDKILDYVWAKINPFFPEVVDFYRSLEAKFTAHVGEKVLLIVKDQPIRLPNEYRPIDLLKYILYIGIINGPELIFDLKAGDLMPSVFIPTAGYVKGETYCNPEKFEGNLGGDWSHDLNIHQFITVNPGNCSITILPEERRKVQIRIGDQEIDKWTEHHLFNYNYKIMLNAMTDLLMRLV